MSVYHYFDPKRREHLDLFYEDDMIALDTTREPGFRTIDGHEIMLPRHTVNDLTKHLTTMRDFINARHPQLAITTKEPTS